MDRSVEVPVQERHAIFHLALSGHFFSKKKSSLMPRQFFAFRVFREELETPDPVAPSLVRMCGLSQ